MNEVVRQHRNHTRVTLLSLILIVLIALLGWGLARANNNSKSKVSPPSYGTTSNSQQLPALISYMLPDGWQEKYCASSNLVLINPSSSTNCGDNAPIKIIKTNQNITDCNQLKPTQSVKKHICKSLFINGYKSLQASTEDLNSQVMNDYYINTGKGIIDVRYADGTAQTYLGGYDSLARSVQLK